MVINLNQRQTMGKLSQALDPGSSYCGRCHFTWSFVKPHYVKHGSGHCFYLCELCWSELSEEARRPFFEALERQWEAAERGLGPDDPVFLEGVVVGVEE